MEFHYDKFILTTQTDLTISLADLRDLIQAKFIKDDDLRWAEMQMILNQICRKNHLPPGSINLIV